ncbi:hypothetical protein F751_1003 [Auxenochlorella protothecoides]|uniref:Fibronectin type-III domain-containing protein n=1 Tax=Auxenochlorella protothecoides TaxID=3075 RepID=A0A087SC53_AUXPR|nr:hypothetical protein F751_1003 [Auxenochlorella protothecoides]KFM23307.1 hypothetical protein F751_1003 [Auxenochlorella protothecoides]
MTGLANGLPTTCTLTARASNPNGGFLTPYVTSKPSASTPAFTPGVARTITGSVVVPADSTEATVKKVEAGKYTCTLTTISTANDIAQTSLNVEVPAAPIELVPATIIGTNASYDSITVFFNGQPEGVRSFNLLCLPKGTETPAFNNQADGSVVVPAGSSEATVKDLEAGVYTCTVTVISTDSQIAQQSTDVTVPRRPVAVAAPEITAVDATSDSVTVRFSGAKADVANHNLACASVEAVAAFSASPFNNLAPGSVVVPADATEATVTGLAPGTYNCTLTSISTDDLISQSSTEAVVKPAPPTPASITGSEATYDAATIFLASAGEGVKENRVSCTTKAGPPSATVTVEPSVGSVEIKDLAAGDYNCTVTTVGVNGLTSASSTTLTISPRPEPPAAPSIIGAAATPEGEITVYFTGPAKGASGFSLDCSPEEAADKDPLAVKLSASAGNGTLTGATPGPYNCSVTTLGAVSGGGSASVRVTVPEAEPEAALTPAGKKANPVKDGAKAAAAPAAEAPASGAAATSAALAAATTALAAVLLLVV